LLRQTFETGKVDQGMYTAYTAYTADTADN
jgi:hypothetical protein